MRLNLNVASNAVSGTYPISFVTSNSHTQVNAQHALSNVDGTESLAHTVSNGWITIDIDDDGDGMGDGWESNHFGSTTNANVGTDHDGDGVMDYEEFPNGTDPNLKDTDGDGMTDDEERVAGTSGVDPDDLLKITAVEVIAAPDEPVIEWESYPGRIYKVYESTDLLLPGWSNAFQAAGDGSIMQYSTTTPPPVIIRVGVEQE